MRPEILIQKLQELKSEGDHENLVHLGAGGMASWKSRVRAAVAAALGENHDLVSKLDTNSYYPSVSYSGMPKKIYQDAFAAGVGRARGYIDATIYSLELLEGADDPVDERSFDPALWGHVKGLVEAEDWGKVASQAAIFTEDKVRTWAELDGSVYGKGVYAAALSDSGVLRLGSRPGEWEGWRALGIGFAQAIGIVDRHRVQDRVDARRYAVGALGLASLLLTQIRHEHSDITEQ